MKIILSTFLLLFSITSQGMQEPTSPAVPKSPREELGVKDTVTRQYDRKKNGKITRESYYATLENGTLISVDCTFYKKEESYLGFWKRKDKPAVTLTPECAHDYFKKLKIAFLQNNTSSQL